MTIELKNVHKAFGEIRVLTGFDLTVDDGETLVVLGGSGSGKSVMLKHIVGLLDPDEGEVHVDGVRVDVAKGDELYGLRRSIGYVFQFAALFDSMSVFENVAMPLRRLEKISPAEIRKRVDESLELVNLDGFGEYQPSELSGGQRKRAGIARAIAARPKYLLYDEPTTGLDPITKAVIDRLILRMAEELKVTAIVITHDIESAYRVADRIAMLHEGRRRFVGTPEEIRATDDPVVKGFIEGRPELVENGS